MAAASGIVKGAAFRTRKAGQRRMGSDDDVVNTILECFENPETKDRKLTLTPMNPEELWALVGLRRDRREKLIAGKIVHQLQNSTYRVNLGACVGVLDRDGLYSLVMASAWDEETRLKRTQPGDWRPIAILFERLERDVLEKVENPRHVALDPSAVNTQDDMERLQQYSRRPITHQWILVHLCWAEFTGADPYDRLAAEFNNRGNPSRAFFESRELAKAPQKVLERYQRCEEIHRDFMSARYPDGYDAEVDAEPQQALKPLPLPPVRARRAPAVQKDRTVGQSVPVIRVGPDGPEAVGDNA